MLISGVVLLVLVVAAAAFGLGASRSSTKTVVRTVTAPAQAAPPVTVDDRGFSKLDNGHQAEGPAFFAPLDPATRLLLQHQLELARLAAMRYPTVADAEAAGWRRAGPFAPGLGAHFLKFGPDGSGFVPVVGPMTDADASHPLSLIYDGTHPNSRIAGLMYLGAGTRIPTEGFAGPDDVWHYHTDVCSVYKPDGSTDTPFGADTTVTKATCDSVHGLLMARTPYMLHAWVVPGYDSPEGIFSHDNAAITCTDGTYHTIALDNLGSRSTVCVDGSE